MDHQSVISIISSMATKAVLAQLCEAFTKLSGTPFKLESVGGVDAAKRVRAGESFDLVILASNAIEQLLNDGKLVVGSTRPLVDSGIYAAVCSGDLHPNISTPEQFKHAVLSAKTLSYSTGPSGVYLEQLFADWGIAQQLREKTIQTPPGVPVGSLIASGQVALGFQQLSELIHLAGIDVLGPLPSAIQLITTFSGAVSNTSVLAPSGLAFLDFIRSPAAASVIHEQGMAPAN
jgi:molybdate transport system substrate-binding protein